MGNVMVFSSFFRAKTKAAASLLVAGLLTLGSITPAWAAAGALSDSATSAYFGGSAEQIDVLNNDTASDGETLDATTLKLCGDGQSMETCAETSVTNSAGSV